MTDQPVSQGGGVPATFCYDGNLKRVKQVMAPSGGSSETIYSVYDASGSLVHRDNVTTSKRIDFVSAAGMSIVRVENGSPTWIAADHLGSAHKALNSAGNVTWEERYTPYGENVLNPAANDNQTGFTGHIQDSASGLTYMQARYYDPVIGRFLSIDPVGFTASGNNPVYFNRYAYTGNDPVNFHDPNGENRKKVLKEFAGSLRDVADKRRIKNAKARARRAKLKQERQQLIETGRSDSNLSPERATELVETGRLKNMHAHHDPSISSGRTIDEKVAIAENSDNLTFMEPADHRKLHSDAGGTHVRLYGGEDVLTVGLVATATAVEFLAEVPTDPLSAVEFGLFGGGGLANGCTKDEEGNPTC